MKKIIISIRPEWLSKILNGEKTIELRKSIPVFPCRVLIYCTKDRKRPIYLPWEFNIYKRNGEYMTDCDFAKGNGKIVAEFTLVYVDKIYYGKR